MSCTSYTASVCTMVFVSKSGKITHHHIEANSHVPLWSNQCHCKWKTRSSSEFIISSAVLSTSNSKTINEYVHCTDTYVAVWEFLAGIRVTQKLWNRRKVPTVMKKPHSIEMSLNLIWLGITLDLWQQHTTLQEEWPILWDILAHRRDRLRKQKHSSVHEAAILNVWYGETYKGNNF
jgi:hypothetical protein